MRNLLYTLAGLAGFALLVAYLNGLGLATKAVVAPASTAIDNRVFHESQQYNDGMARTADEMHRDYVRASTDAERQIVAATALHQFAAYDLNRLPPDSAAFIRSIRGY
jgi:hypothetical protein